MIKMTNQDKALFLPNMEKMTNILLRLLSYKLTRLTLKYTLRNQETQGPSSGQELGSRIKQTIEYV